jgi:hypothetical protein
MLYKFVGMPNGTKTVERLRQIVEDNTLYASSPAAFNDPFEFKVNLIYDTEEQQIQ